MNAKISRISLIVYLVLLLAAPLLLSVAGGNVEWYLTMSVFALPSLILGPRNYRLGGAVALAFGLALAAQDYRAGKHFKAKMEQAKRLHQQPGQEKQPTN